MKSFDDELRGELESLRAQRLERFLRPIDSPQGPRIRSCGRAFLNFSSNDYLGLANDERLKEAALRAIQEYGAGSGASRLISGSLRSHHDLEEALAAFKGTEAALSFSSGYATAVGAIGALAQKEDVVVIDKLAHACVVDGARLCGARLRVFPHNDVDQLEAVLKWADTRRGQAAATRRRRTLIVTESVFSMDGDLAALREIVELKERFGAWLMLDEAHATGIFGPNRRGLAEAFDLTDRVEIQMGTLGKALGAAGGFIAGSRALVDLLINRARSFIFSTAPSPVMAAAAKAAVELVASEEGAERQMELWARVDQLKNGLVNAGWRLPVVRAPIVPLMAGSEETALTWADQLRAAGVFAPAIRYPAVGRGQARIRLTVTAAHRADQIASLLQALGLCARQPEALPDRA